MNLCSKQIWKGMWPISLLDQTNQYYSKNNYEPVQVYVAHKKARVLLMRLDFRLCSATKLKLFARQVFLLLLYGHYSLNKANQKKENGG